MDNPLLLMNVTYGGTLYCFMFPFVHSGDFFSLARLMRRSLGVYALGSLQPLSRPLGLTISTEGRQWPWRWKKQTKSDSIWLVAAFKQCLQVVRRPTLRIFAGRFPYC